DPPSRCIPLQSDGTRSDEAIPDHPGSSQITGEQSSIRSALQAARTAWIDDDTRAAIEVLPTASEALAALGYADRPWMVSDLATALHIEQPTAQKIAAIWVERGAVLRGPARGLAKGRYSFAEVTR